MSNRPLDLARLSIARVAIAGSATLLLAAPAAANQWATEAPVGLNGTTLTYFPHPDQNGCHVTCLNNPQCRGATWIQARTYRPQDPAMCYLLSAVTSRFSMRGHVSMVKPTVGIAPAPTGPVTNLAGRWSWTAKCTEQDYTGAFHVTALGADGSFGGTFENGGGSLSGRIVGNRMEFVRSLSGLQQRWQAVATPNRMDGGIVRTTEYRPDCAFHALRG